MVYAAEGRLTLEYILKTPISAPSVLWYLWFLTAYYVIALVLVRLRVPLLPVMAVCLAGSGLLPSFLRMDRFSALLMFFLLGHYVVERQISLRGRGYLALLGLGAAVAGGVISVLSGSIKYDPLYVWVPVGLILAILWVSSFYRGNAVSGGLEWIGRNSIVFYAVHFPVMMVAARVLLSTTTPSGATLYVAAFLLAVAAGALLQFLRLRFRLAEALFDFRVVARMVGLAGPQASRSRPQDRTGPVETR